MDSSSIQSWLQVRIARLLELEPSQIDVLSPLVEFQLGSLEVTGVIEELDTWLGTTSPATLLYEHENVRSLSDHLATLIVPHR